MQLHVVRDSDELAQYEGVYPQSVEEEPTIRDWTEQPGASDAPTAILRGCRVV